MDGYYAASIGNQLPLGLWVSGSRLCGGRMVVHVILDCRCWVGMGVFDQIGIELSTVESVRVNGSLVLWIFGSLI